MFFLLEKKYLQMLPNVPIHKSKFMTGNLEVAVRFGELFCLEVAFVERKNWFQVDANKKRFLNMKDIEELWKN